VCRLQRLRHERRTEGALGKGHGGGNAPWQPDDDGGKQLRCAVALDGGRTAPTVDDIFGEALQHEADEGEVSGGLI
jgi:hypothetical protein